MALITGTGTTTVTGTGGFLNLGNPGDGVARLSSQGDLTVNIGLNLFKNAQTIGALNGIGDITSNTGGAAANVTLVVGNNNHNGTFSGIIDNNGSEAIKLDKVGTGTQILTGANTYAGGTTIDQGALQLGDGSATNGSIVGGVTISNAGLLIIANPFPQTLSGSIGGPGFFTKTGLGNLTLTGSNSGFSGTLAVNGGTLTLADTTFASAVNVGTNGQNATLVVPAGDTLHQTLNAFTVGASSGSAANVSIAGTLVAITLNVNKTGTANLSGTTTIQGGVTVNGGSLTTASGLSINNAAPLIENGGSWTAASGFVIAPSASLTVTGQNSTLHVLGSINLTSNDQYAVSSGGSLVADTSIHMSDASSLSISGTGSSVSAANLSFDTGGNLSVSSGASLSLSASLNSLKLGPIVNFSINGGNVSVPDIQFNNANVTFTSGSLSTNDGIEFGSTGIKVLSASGAGLIASNTTLANQSLSTTSTTAIDAGTTLTLAAGSLTTGFLTGAGNLSFVSGSLAITSGNFAIGANPIPPVLTINTGSAISVSGNTTLTSSSLLTIFGSFSSGNLINAGTVTVSGSANFTITGSITNNGLFILEPGNFFSSAGNITNNHIMDLGASLFGSGSLTNNDTLTIDGSVSISKTAGLINASTGTVVLSSASLLNLANVSFTSSGLVNLDNGSITGAGSPAFVNNATGRIIGPGSVGVPVTSAGSITTGPGNLTFSSSLANAGSIDTGSGNITTTAIFTSNGTVHASANGTFTASGSARNDNLMTGDPASTFDFTNINFVNNGTFTNAGNLQASSIINNGNFTQSGPQTWDATGAFTNAGNATFHSNAKLAALNITAGTVDITSSKFVIEPTLIFKSAALATLRADIASHALIASGNPANFGLALMDNAALNLTTFGGLPVDSLSILLAPELLGDANADGTVDLTDLSTVLNNFGAVTPNWTDGNFDNQASIDLTDLSDVLNNFGMANTSASAAIPAPTPEPASLALLAAALFAPALRRPRRNYF